MKHRRIPGILDVFKVSQPDEIRAVSLDARADRQFNSRCPVVNGIVLGKLLAALSYAGRRFPTLSPRGDAQRASDQDALWKRLNATAAVARLGSEDLENLGQWIKRPSTDLALGVLVQQAIGRLLCPLTKQTPRAGRPPLRLMEREKRRAYSRPSHGLSQREFHVPRRCWRRK